MKKILVFLCAILLFTGCSCSMNDKQPEEAVETFFEKYRNLDDEIISQLKETVESEITNDNSKVEYEKLMEKQYNQFAYVIKDIEKNDSTAVASIELTVLDYHKALIEAESELEKNPDKFNDDNNTFSEEKYMDYKIKLMKEIKDTTTHTIELNLTKENGMWKVEQLSSSDISKLHGLY